MLRECIIAFFKIIGVLLVILFTVATLAIKIFLMLVVLSFKLVFLLMGDAQYN